MKKITKILSLLLIFVLALGLVGCSSFGKIERELKDDGYTLLTEKLDGQKAYEEVDGVAKVYTFTKTETVAILPVTCTVYVIEFKTTEKMIEFFNESETLKGFVKDLSKNDTVKEMHAKLEKAGLACDNCLIIALGIDADDVYEEIADLND